MSPPIWHSQTYEWYVRPYLENQQRASILAEQAKFMKSLRALTAVAYFLQMTDIHFENGLISEGIPVIIDPECMFYGYGEREALAGESRLWDTGLVSMNSEHSAIRAGTVPVWDFGAKVKNSKISYMREVKASKQHRLLDNYNKLVEPREFSEDILKGFADAYIFLCHWKDQLIDEIKAIAGPRMRTRFLLRLTAHYATVIEMLRHPTEDNETTRLGKVASGFLKSGGLSRQINGKAQRCELLDMLSSDFPFFWVEEVNGQTMLMHWSGSVDALPNSDSLSQRIERAIANCTLEELPLLKKSFEKFFHIPSQQVRIV